MMVFDARGLSSAVSQECDAKPGRNGRIPWVIHTTRELTRPGDYSVEFIWVAHGKPVHRTQYFTIPRP